MFFYWIGKKPLLTLKAYSPSEDDFVEDAFKDKRARVSSKADEHISKKNKKPSASSSTSKSSKPSKPVLSEDLKPGLNLRQTLQPNENKFPMVKIKNFPGPLYEVMKNLKNKQKEAVKSLGFGSLLQFDLNVMPSRLGYWLLQRFDGKSGTLTVFDQTIHITNELVFHTFGFPMGKYAVDVRDVLKERSNEIYIKWKKQFKSNNSRLYVNKDLMPVLRNQIKKNDSGELFQMNFIVLFCTILSHVVSTGTMNTAVIPSLFDLTRVRQLDWCGYVVEYLKSERLVWDERKPYFGGLLLLEVISLSLMQIKFCHLILVHQLYFIFNLTLT